MNLHRIKEVLKKIFFLPPVPTLLIAIPAYGFVIYVLTVENIKPAEAYAAYLLSAYAFILTITGITGIVHWFRIGIENHPVVRRMLTNDLIHRYTKEAGFRQIMTSCTGAGVSLIVVGMAVYMIIRSTKELKRERTGGNHDTYISA